MLAFVSLDCWFNRNGYSQACVEYCNIRTNLNGVLFHLKRKLCDLRKIPNPTGEFHIKFHLKNRYCTHRFTIRAPISVLRVKLNVQFSRQVGWFIYIKGTRQTFLKTPFDIFNAVVKTTSSVFAFLCGYSCITTLRFVGVILVQLSVNRKTEFRQK